MPTRTSALANLRASDFSGVSASRYGRAARTSAKWAATGLAGTSRAGRSTRRSYLADHGAHGVGPVLEGMLLDDTAPRFLARRSALGDRRGRDGVDHAGKCAWVPRWRHEWARQT